MMRFPASSSLPMALGLMVLMGIASTCACPPDFLRVAGVCLKFGQQALSVDRAASDCRASNAQLLELMSNAEKESIVDHVNRHYKGQYWTSGMSRYNEYIWSESDQTVPQAFRGRNFKAGNNRCVYLCSSTHKLWDGDCSAAKKFICEYTVLP